MWRVRRRRGPVFRSTRAVHAATRPRTRGTQVQARLPQLDNMWPNELKILEVKLLADLYFVRRARCAAEARPREFFCALCGVPHDTWACNMFFFDAFRHPVCKACWPEGAARTRCYGELFLIM